MQRLTEVTWSWSSTTANACGVCSGLQETPVSSEPSRPIGTATGNAAATAVAGTASNHAEHASGLTPSQLAAIEAIAQMFGQGQGTPPVQQANAASQSGAAQDPWAQRGAGSQTAARRASMCPPEIVSFFARSTAVCSTTAPVCFRILHTATRQRLVYSLPNPTD